MVGAAHSGGSGDTCGGWWWLDSSSPDTDGWWKSPGSWLSQWRSSWDKANTFGGSPSGLRALRPLNPESGMRVLGLRLGGRPLGRNIPILGALLAISPKTLILKSDWEKRCVVPTHAC